MESCGNAIRTHSKGDDLKPAAMTLSISYRLRKELILPFPFHILYYIAQRYHLLLCKGLYSSLHSL